VTLARLLAIVRAKSGIGRCGRLNQTVICPEKLSVRGPRVTFRVTLDVHAAFGCASPTAWSAEFGRQQGLRARTRRGVNRMGSHGQKGRGRSWTFGCVLGMAAMGLAACGSGSSSSTSTVRSTPTTSSAGPTTTTTGGSTSGNQAAVLSAWQSAQQTLYGYLQAPWQQDRANLVAGQTAATLWPNLANYFVDPALKSEQTFLVGVKMGQLNGPTSFDLGTPKVVALAPMTATVAGCIHDTGTATATGAPGPPTLGGGAGYASGTWDLVLVGGTWKVASFKTTTVPKC